MATLQSASLDVEAQGVYSPKPRHRAVLLTGALFLFATSVGVLHQANIRMQASARAWRQEQNWRRRRRCRPAQILLEPRPELQEQQATSGTPPPQQRQTQQQTEQHQQRSGDPLPADSTAALAVGETLLCALHGGCAAESGGQLADVWRAMQAVAGRHEVQLPANPLGFVADEGVLKVGAGAWWLP